MRSMVAALAVSSVVWTGCITSKVEGIVDDVACGLYKSPERELHGSEGVAFIAGVCTDETCNADKPLAVGSDHPFTLDIGAKALEGKGRADIELVSDDSAVVAVVDVEAQTFEEERDQTGELVDGTAVKLRGTIKAKKAGRTRLLLKQGDTVLDRYDLTLADIHAAHVERLGDDVSEDDLASSGLALQLDDITVELAAVATTRDGRELVLSNANVTWSVDDPKLLELDARPYSQPCGVHGPGAEVYGTQTGATQVHVDVGEIEQTIDVTVR